MHVVVLHGPPAAGKYTIGVKLAELTGLPLFHNHLAVDAAKSLFEFGTPPFQRIRATIWQAAFGEASKARRSFIFTFNPEKTVDPELITGVRATVRSAGGEIHFVQLTCSRETILRRIGNASRKKFGKLTDPEAFREAEARGAFDFPPLPQPLLVVDTDEHDAETAARMIARALVTAHPDG